MFCDGVTDEASTRDATHLETVISDMGNTIDTSQYGNQKNVSSALSNESSSSPMWTEIQRGK